MAIRVVFFGSIGIAKKILQDIVIPKGVEVLGVCCEKVINNWRNEESVYEFALRTGIPVLELSEVSDLHADIGISIRFNKIIQEDVINSFRLGIVNSHGGILPEYRGSYCNINAILNGETEYGVTLHYIHSGVDDGDIIDIKKIQITDDCTGLDLYRESERLCYEVVQENIDALLAGINRRVTQAEYIKSGHVCNLYKRDNTIKAKDLTGIDMNSPLWLRTVRAFDSPYHEPAYVNVGEKKVYVRYRYGDENANSRIR